MQLNAVNSTLATSRRRKMSLLSSSSQVAAGASVARNWRTHDPLTREKEATRIAMWEGSGEVPQSDWGDHVTDAEYDRR